MDSQGAHRKSDIVRERMAIIIQQESITQLKPELTNPYKFRDQPTTWWRHIRAILWLKICMQHYTMGSRAFTAEAITSFCLTVWNVLIISKTCEVHDRYGMTDMGKYQVASLFSSFVCFSWHILTEQLVSSVGEIISYYCYCWHLLRNHLFRISVLMFFTNVRKT